MKLGGQKPIQREIPALTVADALERARRQGRQARHGDPGPDTELEDGDKIVFTDVRVVTRHVEARASAQHHRARGLLAVPGRPEVVRAGRTGVRDVTYRLVYRNGDLAVRKVRPPAGPATAEAVRPRTRSAPRRRRRRPRPNFASGSTRLGPDRRSASPAATGPRTPATATTAGSSSTWAPGVRTAAPAARTRPAARPRSRSPRRSGRLRWLRRLAGLRRSGLTR